MILSESQQFASPEEALEHFGIRGMKWGVRKQDQSAKPEIKSLVDQPITRTTKNGDTFTLNPKPTGKVTQFLAKHNPKYRSLVEKSGTLDIKDKSGKTIGNLQIYAVSKKEMNITWIDIEQSARGHGYAQAVMKSAEDIARQKSFKKLTLEVPGISPDARHIYEKQGFKVTKKPGAIDKHDVWGGLTEMEKPLD